MRVEWRDTKTWIDHQSIHKLKEIDNMCMHCEKVLHIGCNNWHIIFRSFIDNSRFFDGFIGVSWILRKTHGITNGLDRHCALFFDAVVAISMSIQIAINN